MNLSLQNVLFLAAGFDWESLLPLLFFVLYGLAQFLGARKEAQNKEKEAAGRKKKTVPPSEVDENTRRIQEEIRRKIAERLGQPQGQPSMPPPAQTAEAPRRLVVARPHRPMDTVSERPELSPLPRPVVREPVLLPSDGPSALEQALREQRQRLELARRERESAVAKARSMMKEASARISGGRREKAVAAPAGAPVPLLRSEVLSALSSPGNARKAIVLSEVLGRPVGLRRGSSGLWDA